MPVENAHDQLHQDLVLAKFVANKDKRFKARDFAAEVGMQPDFAYSRVKKIVKQLNTLFLQKGLPRVIIELPNGFVYTENAVTVREAIDAVEKKIAELNRDAADLRDTLKRISNPS